MAFKIPLTVPSIGELEERRVLEALRKSEVSGLGEFVTRFEGHFAEAHNMKHALAVSNGTVALHLALLALGIKKDDEVIVPSLTYIAPVNAIRYVGAEPVFVDVDRDTWCISASAISAAVSPRTRAIMAVNLYGMVPNFEAIRSVARKHQLVIIEDAAESLFARRKGQLAGSFGDVSTFSFYGNKLLTAGEGGAVLTKSADLADQMRLLRGQGMDPNRRYYFPVVGYNYRLSNIQAALLYAQFERRDVLFQLRAKVIESYRELLGNSEQVTLRELDKDVLESPWLMTVLINEMNGRTRSHVMTKLNALGIETRPIFLPIHTLPPYLNCKRGDLTVTEDLSARGISLPTHPNLSEGDVSSVVEAIIS